MKLFLDTGVLLAAAGSARGASREVFRRATALGWELLATPFVIEEAPTNLPDLPRDATLAWMRIRPSLSLADDVFTLDKVAMFGPAKDRPILFSALASADVLLSLDRRDFVALLGRTFYDLMAPTPGQFLEQERAAGRLPAKQ